jgi:exodeoxyribonuclease-5
MEWSPQQAAALDAAAKWARDRRGPQIFRMFGYAGSGKTTLARHMADGIDGSVVYGAFTGKASMVLRSKGCDGASTIHSLIYKPVQDENSGIVTYHMNPDSPVATAALVIIDEVSMVGEELARDLLSYGTKVLVLGDPAQLPPVKGEGFFINAEPDVMLTEVHRQAAESPIIRMSMDVREGRGLKPGRYGECRVVARSEVDRDELRASVEAADQVLCGMNKTRQAYNTRIREIRGFRGSREPWHPAVGDRLVCLRNNRNKGLLNGGLWDVVKTRVTPWRKHPRFEMEVKSVDEPGMAHVEVVVPAEFFLGLEKDMDWRELKEVDHFTFGGCLTVHKSQGSQWQDVLLFDESGIFREDADKHRYTGITRAADRLTVVLP